jgi:hypothetical protein
MTLANSQIISKTQNLRQITVFCRPSSIFSINYIRVWNSIELYFPILHLRKSEEELKFERQVGPHFWRLF